MPQLKFGNALLCDYASLGSNNKHTLVGVYSGDIYLEAIPMPMVFGMYIEHIPDKSGSIELMLSCKINDRSIIAVQASATVQKKRVGVLLIQTPPLLIESAGTFKLIAESAGYAPTTIMTKEVILGPVPILPTA